jgi:hypothetical protein
MNKLILLLFSFFVSNAAMSNEFQLRKSSTFFHDIGYNLFVKITKSKEAKYKAKIVVSNRQGEYITISNGRIEFEKSSFMFPMNEKKLFIVSPLRSCKIEFIGQNERTQLNGVEFVSDSCFIYFLEIDRNCNYYNDSTSQILSYIPIEENDDEFLGFFLQIQVTYCTLY